MVSLNSMNSGWRRLHETWLWISFDFFQKTFFPKFELLNSGCSLSAGTAYLWVRLICGFLWYVEFVVKHPYLLLFLEELQLNPTHPNIIMHILHTVLWYIYTYIHIYIYWSLYIREFVKPSRVFVVGDHFLYSLDLNVWFWDDMVKSGKLAPSHSWGLKVRLREIAIW